MLCILSLAHLQECGWCLPAAPPSGVRAVGARLRSETEIIKEDLLIHLYITQGVQLGSVGCGVAQCGGNSCSLGCAWLSGVRLGSVGCCVAQWGAARLSGVRRGWGAAWIIGVRRGSLGCGVAGVRRGLFLLSRNTGACKDADPYIISTGTNLELDINRVRR